MPHAAHTTPMVAADPIPTVAKPGGTSNPLPADGRCRSGSRRRAWLCGMQLGLTVSLALLLAFGTLTDPAAADSIRVPLGAIGRVLDHDNQFKCTGFIIASVLHRPTPSPTRASVGATAWYENTMVTAGHCLEHTHFFLARDGLLHTIHNIVGYSDHESGYDVLIAKFATSTVMSTLDPAYRYTLSTGDVLMHVGYGRGVLQITVNPFVGYSNRGDLIVDGISGPGASGSPIILPGTRRVIAILHSGTVDVPQEGRNNPYFCMFQSCPSTRPYYATPIDRIQGIAR